MLNDGEIYAIGEDFLIEGETAFALISHDGTLWVLSEGRVIEKESPFDERFVQKRRKFGADEHAFKQRKRKRHFGGFMRRLNIS